MNWQVARKKLTYILRPTLPRRAIVWFPSFTNQVIIDRFRGTHDPQAQALAPHVTLVFPFHSRLSLDQLAAHTQKVLRSWPCFPVVMHGFWSAQNEFIGVGTQVGTDALIEMHDRLYRGPLAEFQRPEFDYAPHITLAKAVQPNQFESLARAASLVTRESFRDLMKSVTIIRNDAENEWVEERKMFLHH
jgi:2'-5' RNA ligase